MNNNQQLPEQTFTRLQLLMAMAITAVVLLIISKVWQYVGNVSLLKWEVSVEAIALGCGMAVGIMVASSLLYYLWPAYRRSANNYLEVVLKPLEWVDLIWVGLLPGLSEELLFRGVMIPALGLNLIAVIFSSLLFGILHLNGVEQWPYVVWATVVGFILGYVALMTGNLLVPIIAHVTTNFVSSFIWKKLLLTRDSI